MTSTLTSQPTDPVAHRGPDRRTIVRTGALLSLAVVAGLAVAWAAVGRFAPHLYAGTVLQGDDPAPALDGLVFTDGAPADLAAFDDQVVMVFFGYTSCPDVCPITLATAAAAMSQLDPADRDRTRLVMVTVDPEVDTPERLERYVESFHPQFLGATGSRDAIADAASRYGVFHHAGGTADGLIDHTASVLGIAPDGSLRILWSPDVTADQLAADISKLL